MNLSDSVFSTPLSGAPNCCLHERRRAAPVLIGDLHAARIVQQHAEEVLLRDRGLDDEDGPEEAEREQREERGRASP